MPDVFMSLLSSIHSPEDLKKLPREALPTLAQEVRDYLIQVVSNNGGHLGPNLGVVEMTIALHRVFNTPEDKFLFDVAHQGYVHKLFTGRQGKAFENIRQTGGLCGFLTREESEHDCYGAGHAGTALSAALGMATARDRLGLKNHVVAVLGDAAFTCGITMEALNNIATSTKRLIIVLNDNEWSIAKNVGAIAKYLNELITNPIYNRLHQDFKSFLLKMPGGETLKKMGSRAKTGTKELFLPSSLFEKYGLRYLGPIDGHNLDQMVQYLEYCKQSDEPIILHALTTKGKGYDVALQHPEKFHGPGAFDITTGKSKSGGAKAPKYQDVFGKEMMRMAKQDSAIMAITAATPLGSGLTPMAEALPEQFMDVGIAEEHAVLFAAGLAAQGMKPVCGIYSTFLQRAFDPIIHDVCLQNLKVMFCMDRAGLSAADGATHHGLFDIAYTRMVPGALIMQPKDEDELVDMMHTGMAFQGPSFIRYPRGPGQGVPIKARPSILELGKAEVMRVGKDIQIWSLGPRVYEMLEIAKDLEDLLGVSVGVVNSRFIKPLDEALLLEQAQDTRLFVIWEDGIVAGGFGSALLEVLQQNNQLSSVECIGWPDRFIDHASNDEDLRERYGLGRKALTKRIVRRFERLSGVQSVSYQESIYARTTELVQA